MVDSSMKHPDDIELTDYLKNPDSSDYQAVSLHLAVCEMCRKQLNMMQQLKLNASNLNSQHCDKEQQQKVDSFIYGNLSAEQSGSLRDEIKNDPIALKSALHSLSQQINKYPIDKTQQELKPKSDQTWTVAWFQKMVSSWFSIPVTAVMTMILTMTIMQFPDILNGQQKRIDIASYQDDKNIRFVSQKQLPGIGFFSSANQQSEPYQGVSISVINAQQLKLEWQPVQHAIDYTLSINRYSDGKKILHDKKVLSQPETTVLLNEEDFNQRFEWTLSGNTTEQKTFITSGGFVLTRNKN